MPERNPIQKFFKKLGDRIVYILTGEAPRKHHSHRHKIRPGLSEMTERLPDVPVEQKARRRKKKSKLPEFLNKLINPEKGRTSRVHSGKVILPHPDAVNPSETESASSPVLIEPDMLLTQRNDRPVAVRQHKPYRKKSVFRRLFGKRVREKKDRKTQQPFMEELRRVMPEERSALFNSLGLYILAYLFVYLLYQFTETIAAANFDIDSVLFYYEIYFPIGNASSLWTRFNIIVITLASPMISILLAIILLRVVLQHEKLKPQPRLFLLWVAFHGATHFFGAFVAGIATSQGFGYVANWLYMNVFFRILVSLIFLFLLTLTGYYSAVFALETLPAGVRQHRWRLSLALGTRLIIPWILGGLIIILIKIPDSVPQHPNIMVYDAIIIASMGFMVIPAFFNKKAKPRSVAERPSRHKRPPGFLITAVAVLSLILFRLAFERGIHFVINFSFDVGFYR